MWIPIVMARLPPMVPRTEPKVDALLAQPLLLMALDEVQVVLGALIGIWFGTVSPFPDPLT